MGLEYASQLTDDSQGSGRGVGKGLSSDFIR